VLRPAEGSTDSATEAPTVDVGLRLENDRDTASGLAGARVVEVLPGSLAERAGLRAGDLIVRFEGRPAPVAVELLELLARPAEGPRRLDVLRGGEALRVEVP
jgi:S1-C subfamily serine protease